MPIYRVTVDYGYETLDEFGVEAKDLYEAQAVGAKHAGRMLIVEAHDDAREWSEKGLEA